MQIKRRTAGPGDLLHSLKNTSHYPRHYTLTIILTLITLLTCTCATTAYAQPNLTVSRDTINFGYKVITEPVGKSHLVTLKNTGNQTLTFTTPAFQITGDHATDFTITTAPATYSMAPNSERYIHIAFGPTSLGEKQADLLISTSDPDTPVTTVTLTGHAVPARATTAYGPFDGYGPGQSTIGTGGDYPSLYEATEAISATPLTGGDWDFIILNDLHEPNHCTIKHENNNGHTITFRPAPDTSPRVTFTTTVQTGQAHITLNEPTSHVTIDGAPASNETSITLTFANVSPAGSTLIQGLRNCDYITIRNCRFEQEGYYYGSSWASPSFNRISTIINFRFRALATHNPDTMADYITVSKCDFVSTEAVFCQAILINDMSAPEAWMAQTNHSIDLSKGLRISDNTVCTFGTGISLQNSTMSIIENNRIVMNPDSIPGTDAFPRSGIYVASSSSVTQPSDISVNGNRILIIDAALYAADTNGIFIYSRDANAVYKILNNTVTGLRGHAYKKSSGLRSQLFSNSSFSVVAHNSFYFRNDAPVQDAGLDNTTAISQVGALHYQYANRGTAILANNIIHMGNTTGTAIMPFGPITSNHNNIITSPNGRVGQIGSEVYTTLADWQTSTGHDLASISQDPFVPAGDGLGTWVGPADAENPDLHFTSFPGEMYLAPPLNESTHLTTVPTDIDGEPRNPIATLMGAD